MGLIFFLSQQPGDQSGNSSRWVLDLIASVGIDLKGWFGDNAMWVVRKGAHFFEYFMLFWFAFLGLGRWKQGWERRLWAVGIAFVYALTDEFHQLFIPGRVADLPDVLVDTSGAGFGALLNWGWNALRKGAVSNSDKASSDSR